MPYLLRRDKREDSGVKAFTAYTRLPMHAYRRESEIQVDIATLSQRWKEAVCAAEALSLVLRQVDGSQAEQLKRLRLTLGNGHGIATMLHQPTHNADQDREQDRQDEPESQSPQPVVDDAKDKSVQRARWWHNIVVRSVGSGDTALFEHPAILSAVEVIEDAHRQGEKILVFGRFTRPLQALTDLLNARELLRCLDEGRPWPQSKVHEDEWPAIQAAHCQLELAGDPDRRRLDKRLAEQYKGVERRRARHRANLVDNLQQGMDAQYEENSHPSRLFAAFRRALEHRQGDEIGGKSLALVASALNELLPESNDPHPPKLLAQSFVELVDALCERDEGDWDGDGKLDPAEADSLWSLLVERIVEEYKRRRGGFAELMYGGTKPETRRLLQLAFNRSQSYPRVLVAQSMVGREGLNLHRACRTVVLLHPEWNPGVVEQQIGRVDRVGSHWETQCREKIQSGCNPDDLPCIEVRPIIFKGTYDEKHWEVLRRRWDDLRAQLHGVIIPPREAEFYRGMECLIEEINGAAPNFSPLGGKDPR